MGWELEGSGTTRQGCSSCLEREPPKISLGTFQLQGQREGTQESLLQPSPASLASLAGWEFIPFQDGSYLRLLP